MDTGFPSEFINKATTGNLELCRGSSGFPAPGSQSVPWGPSLRDLQEERIDSAILYLRHGLLPKLIAFGVLDHAG